MAEGPDCDDFHSTLMGSTPDERALIKKIGLPIGPDDYRIELSFRQCRNLQKAYFRMIHPDKGSQTASSSVHDSSIRTPIQESVEAMTRLETLAREKARQKNSHIGSMPPFTSAMAASRQHDYPSQLRQNACSPPLWPPCTSHSPLPPQSQPASQVNISPPPLPPTTHSQQYYPPFPMPQNHLQHSNSSPFGQPQPNVTSASGHDALNPKS